MLRAFVREPFEKERFGRANAELTDVSLTVGRWMAAMFPVVMLVLNVSSVAVLWFGGSGGCRADGDRVADRAPRLPGPDPDGGDDGDVHAGHVPRAAVSADRIAEVLGTESSVVPPANGVTELTRRGELELRGVEFCYPGAVHSVLHDVSFTAPRTDHRHRLDRAGRPHCSTWIPRLFDATGGKVLVDGVDIRDIDPEALWARIGLVPQRPSVHRDGRLQSPLREPLRHRRGDVGRMEIAQAADFVRAMPDGLEAHVAQGGTNLSGGQKQRLAIARAIIRRPEIYLFDDSFSALDLATDARLRRALKPVTADATVLIVASLHHRRRRSDRGARGRRGRRIGYPRRVARRLSYLRGDRRIAAECGGVMTSPPTMKTTERIQGQGGPGRGGPFGGPMIGQSPTSAPRPSGW